MSSKPQEMQAEVCGRCPGGAPDLVAPRAPPHLTHTPRACSPPCPGQTDSLPDMLEKLQRRLSVVGMVRRGTPLKGAC